MFVPSLAKNLRTAISTVFYDGRVVPRHTEYEHFYEDTVDGSIYPSVTARTGILDKPYLKQWAANKAVDYLLKFIEDNPEYEKHELDTAAKAARNVHKTLLKQASSWGSQGHDIVDNYVKMWIEDNRPENIKDIIPDDTEPEAISAALGAEKFFKEYHLYPIVSEKKLVSKKNACAGTLDTLFLIGEVYKERHGDSKCQHQWWEKAEDKLWCEKCGRTEQLLLLLLDLKTSNSVYDHVDYPIQVSGYGSFLTEMVGIKCQRYWILHVSKEKPEYDVAVIKDHKSAAKAFVLMNQIAQYLNDNQEPMESINKKKRIRL